MTTGDAMRTCQNCGGMYYPQIGHECQQPIRLSSQPQTGWICPACGKGNAPWKGACDCVGAVEEPSDNTGGPLKHGVDPTGAIKRVPAWTYTNEEWSLDINTTVDNLSADDITRAFKGRGWTVKGA